jgi:hypothetical protein
VGCAGDGVDDGCVGDGEGLRVGAERHCEGEEESLEGPHRAMVSRVCRVSGSRAFDVCQLHVGSELGVRGCNIFVDLLCGLRLSRRRERPR